MVYFRQYLLDGLKVGYLVHLENCFCTFVVVLYVGPNIKNLKKFI